MPKPYNFSAGPGVLPAAVLKQARDELVDWHGRGLSIMEMSHRGPDFAEIAAAAEAGLRELMQIPDGYRVLFVHGGATGQFAAVPLNLCGQSDVADYVVTGMWGAKAHAEAARYLDGIRIAAGTDVRIHVPPQDEWRLSERAAYVHITPNETIDGVAFSSLPDTGGIPLVADVSSVILTEPIDVNRFGVLYAGAQKNLGVAGLAVVIVRDDLLGRARQCTPTVWNWSDVASSGSLLNTPPTYNWYVTGLVLAWLKREGGVAAIAQINQRKARSLYAAIDGSDFYANPVAPANRSRVNVPFSLARRELEQVFLEQARAAGLTNLEGHRSVGGLRASIYNAMPEAGVDALVAFMKDFENKYG